jgi:hypothetical protein
MGGPGSGRRKKVGRPKGTGKPKKRGRPAKRGRPSKMQKYQRAYYLKRKKRKK